MYVIAIVFLRSEQIPSYGHPPDDSAADNGDLSAHYLTNIFGSNE